MNNAPTRPHLFWPNLTVFVTGMCIMTLELSAGRLISRHLGQSLYTWTSVIGIVLAGLSIGNYIGGRLADSFNARRTLVALFLLSSFTCLAIPGLNHLVGDWKHLLLLSWPARIFSHVFVTFLIPSICLGTISPAVAKMALERHGPVGRTIGNVYAWGTAGSICGTFLTGFYLVANLGTIAVIVLVGLALGLMGLAYGAGIKWRIPAALLYIIISAAAFFPHPVLANIGSSLSFRSSISGRLLFEAESQYQYISVRANPSNPNIRGLYLDKMLHSEMDVTRPTHLLYRYAWIYEAIIESLKPNGAPVKAFVIGGGGLTFPQYLALTRPGGLCDVAEIDPEVTRAAIEYCGYKAHPEVNIHHMDARNFVTDQIRKLSAGTPTARYDFVFGDTFNDYSVPFHLVTREFNEQLSSLMTDNGIYMLNMIDAYDSGLFLGSILKTFQVTFPYVYAFFAHRNLAVRGTYVVIASKQRLQLTDMIERVKQRHPEFLGQMLSAEQIQVLTHRQGVTVLTDNFAPVENLLARVVREDRPDGVEVMYLKKGLQEAEAGNFFKAIELFEQGLSINAANYQLHYNLGVALMNTGRRDIALDAFMSAIYLKPDYGQARVNAGVLLANMGKLDDAASQFKEVISLDPANVDARINYSAILAAVGRTDEAQAVLLDAFQLAPSNTTVLSNLGELAMREGRKKESIAYFTKALQLDPHLQHARARLAELATDQN